MENEERRRIRILSRGVEAQSGGVSDVTGIASDPGYLLQGFRCAAEALTLKHGSRECQQDDLRIINIDTLADRNRKCARGTGNFPVLGFICLPSPGHTLCGIRSAVHHES
jgi:hypothetical protein